MSGEQETPKKITPQDVISRKVSSEDLENLTKDERKDLDNKVAKILWEDTQARDKLAGIDPTVQKDRDIEQGKSEASSPENDA